MVKLMPTVEWTAVLADCFEQLQDASNRTSAPALHRWCWKAWSWPWPTSRRIIYVQVVEDFIKRIITGHRVHMIPLKPVYCFRFVGWRSLDREHMSVAKKDGKVIAKE